jgi:predicted amidohydrolase YtcJ
MLESYIDAPGNNGSSCLCGPESSEEEQVEELHRMIELAHCRGFQVGIHAIGDKAIEASMDGFIKAEQKYPGRHLRHYIIHAESLGRPEQAVKAARYKIPYSVQPAISDNLYEVTRDLIGPRAERCFDLKTPLDEGVMLCGGSDAIAGVFPNWRMAVQSAVTRRSAISGKVYSPELRVSVEDAVRMFTIGAVYQESMEDVRGSIEIGKLADFQVLDRDIFETPHDEIGAIKVVMTIVDGKVVYDSRQP